MARRWTRSAPVEAGAAQNNFLDDRDVDAELLGPDRRHIPASAATETERMKDCNGSAIFPRNSG